MELFEKIKRPRAEMRVINAFLPKLDLGIQNYKQKEYGKCIAVLLECKSMIIPIDDTLPKCKISYYLMKSYYKHCHYQNCKDELNKLNEMIEKIDKEASLYIKSKIKIYLYQTLSNIILNNNKESISNIINTIEYIKQKQFNADKRAYFFWIFIKGFLGEAGLNKTKQWEQFHDYYDTMREEAEEEKINKIIKDVYKTLMSTKTRKTLFDYFNNAFFLHKYGLSDDNKVISFLEKNLSFYVRENNLAKLRLKVEGYLHLAKLNFKDYFSNITLVELLTEQKFRLLSFDTVFGNICGGFNAILKEYFIENKENRDAHEKMKLILSYTGDDHDESELNLNDNRDDKTFEYMKPEKEVLRKSENSVQIKNARTIQMKTSNIQYKLSRNEFEIKKSCTVFNPHFDFSK